LPFRDLSVGAGYYSDQSFWWRHEAFHTSAILRYENVLPIVQKYILDGETQWTARLPAHAWDSADSLLAEISHGAFRESDSQEKAMVERMKKNRKDCLLPVILVLEAYDSSIRSASGMIIPSRFLRLTLLAASSASSTYY